MTSNGAVTPALRPRFASGAAVKLPLSEGDWVLVRAELSYGQQRRLLGATLDATAGAASDGRVRVDYAAYAIERLVTWLLDWSFRDGDGDPVIVSRQAIEALHPDTAAEIDAALDAHLEALEAKKAPPAQEAPAGFPAPPGPSGPAATSPSAAPSAGAGTS